MIPQEIADFISRPGQPMCFGTHDAALQTSVGRAFALKLSEDRKLITFMVPKITAAKHVDNLLQNGRLAFTTGNAISHVCYQLKGKYVAHADSTPEELEILGKSFAAFMELLVASYGEQAKEIFARLDFGPMLSITFAPEDIFDQTPGPGAGKKIFSVKAAGEAVKQ